MFRNGTRKADAGPTVTVRGRSAELETPKAQATVRARAVRWAWRVVGAFAATAVALPTAVPAVAMEPDGLNLNGEPVRYATPMAAVAFTSEEAGTFYFKVLGADADAPSSPQDLVDGATGSRSLAEGANTLILKGAAQGMDSPDAKTVYLAAQSAQGGDLSAVVAAEVPAAGATLTLINGNTNTGSVAIAATSAETYKVASGLVNTPDAIPGSASGWWAELNGVDGLRLDDEAIVADRLSGNKAISVSGESKNFATPLRVTVKDVALA
jgi:hypothetical protein